MTTPTDVWQYLYGKAIDQGLKFDPRSGLKNNRRTCDLVRAVQKILQETGYECDYDAVQKVLELRIPNLVSSWTGVDTEAHRAVDKFFKVNPDGLEKLDDAKDDDGNGDDEEEGHHNDGKDDHDGDGDGDEERGDDDGNKGKDRIRFDPIPEPTPEPDPEPTPEPNPVPVPPIPVPVPDPDPVPEPQDPNYVRPKIWNSFMKILMWNMEHPGKQKNVMLVGPRGVGKTELVIQAAKTLHEFYPEMAELPFMITSPQMKHEVTGYGNAQGEAVRTEFTKGYVSAGLTLVEEMDRSEPTALIAMNAAMANKIMDTPVIGMIEQHPLCTIVATANTAGVGATEEYVTANQLDASTRDRFVYLTMEFDVDLAVQIARGDRHLVEFVKRWNDACETCGLIQNTCSYRALIDVKDLRDGMGFTIREALEQAILKACMPKDNLRSVLDKMKDISMNPYYSAMELVEAAMPTIAY